MKTRRFASMLALVLMAMWSVPVAALAAVELEPIIATDGEEYDAFGQAVEIGEFGGSYAAFVGAPGVDGNSGAVYLLSRSIDGWVEQAMIHPDVATGADFFGTSIDGDGDYLVVGAPEAQKSLNQKTGLAYVFSMNGTGSWSQQAVLVGTDIAPSDDFGEAVAVSGNYFLVGAPYADTTQDDAGAAYVFENSSGVWTQKKLVPATPVAFALFGSSVAITGEWAFVGAPWENTPAGVAAGAVYIFKKEGSKWNQKDRWTAGVSRHHFGESMSAYGDYVVIGGTGGGITNGSAYVYKKDNDVWSLVQTLTSDSPYAKDQFGISVSISSSRLLVGSVAKDTGIGAAYLYQLSGTTWAFMDSYVAHPDFSNNDDYFGKAVAVSEEFLIVGADGYDEPGQDIENVGAVFVDQSGDVANLTPVISAISDIYRNGTTVFTVPFTIADANDTSLTVVSATSDNQDVLPDANLTLTAGAMPYIAELDAENKRDLSLQMLPVGFGSANITITVQDGGGKQARETFSLIVTHPPIFSLQDPVEIDEDEVHSFTIEFSDEDGDPLAISVASDNPGLVPAGGLLLNGGGSPLDVTLDPVTNDVMVTLTIDPVDNANSGPALDNTAEITVSATDGGAPVVKSFMLIVTPVNDLPTVSAIDNVNMEEDGEKIIAFTVSDIDSNVSDPGFAVTATSNNAGLIPNENLVVGGAGTARTLTITPLPDANSDIEGDAVITVTAQDDKGGKATRNFTLTVTPVDDLPLIVPDPLPNAETGEDTPLVYSFTVHHGDEESLTVTVTSDNQSILPDENILINGNASPRTIIMPGKNALVDLELTPAPNKSGSLIVLVQVADQSGNLADDTFRLTVNNVNDPPTISDIDDITIPEDTDAEIEVTFDDSDDLITTLTLEYESSNPGLLPLANIVAVGTGGTRTITLTPLPDKHGTTDVTIRVKDPQGASRQTKFKLTVTSVNDDPVITIDEGPYTVNEDQVFGPLAFTVTDVDGDALTVEATSQASAVVADSGISIIGIGSNRQVTVTPEANASGSVGIELTVSDGKGGSDIGYFLLNVVAVNDSPEISGLNNFYSINEDTNLPATGFLSFTVTDVDGDTMLVTGGSDNDALVPDANIQLGGTGSNRTLRVVPASNKSGTANITVTANDQKGETNSTATFMFELEVVEINDLPVISNVVPVGNIGEDEIFTSPQISICDVDATYLLVTLSSSDPTLLPRSGLDILYNSVNKNYVFAISGGDLDANGCNTLPVDIRITPGLNQSGSGSVTITVEDNTGATATSDIVLVVDEVDDPPIIGGNPDTDAIVGELYEFTPTASDPEGEQITFTIAYEDDGGVAQALPAWLDFDTATGKLSGTPGDSDQGTTENIIINVKDPSGQLADPPLSFKITVTREEAKPVINDGAGIATPQTVNEMLPGDDPREIAFTVTDANGDTLDLSVVVNGTTSTGEPSAELIDSVFIVDAADDTVYFDAGADIVDPSDDVAVPLDTDLGVPVNLKLILALKDYANSDLYGTVKLTVSVDDRYAWVPALTWKPFTLVVNPVFSAPVLLTLPEPPDEPEPLMNKTFTAQENETKWFGFQVFDPDGGVLTLEANSDNSELLPDGNIDIFDVGFGNSYTFSTNANGYTELSMRLKPVASESGTSRITLTLTGEGRPTATAIVVYKVGSINDAPTIEATLTTWTMEEGTEKTFTFTVDDADSDNLTLTITAEDDLFPVDGDHIRINGNLYSPGMTLLPTVYANPIQITIIPDPNFNTDDIDPPGPITMTVTVSDGLLSTDTPKFNLVIEPSNDPPSIDQPIDPQIMDEDDTEDVQLLVSDPDGDTLEVEFASSNEDLIKAENIMLMVGGEIIGGELVNAQEKFPRIITEAEYGGSLIHVRIIPEPNANSGLFGVALITVRVKDVTTSAETIFRVSVTPDANDPPSVSDDFSDRAINEGEELTFRFYVADADEDTLTVAVMSDNPDVLPNNKANIYMEGDPLLVGDTLNGQQPVSGDDWVQAAVKTEFGGLTAIDLTLKPLADQFAVAPPVTLSVFIGDGTVDLPPIEFTLTVDPINDPPVIMDLFSVYSMVLDTPQDIVFKIKDVDSTLSTLQVIVQSSNTTLVPSDAAHLKLSAPVVDLNAKTATYTLTIENDANATVTPPYGTTNISVTVNDLNGGQDDHTFELRVFPDNAQIPEVSLLSPDGPNVDMYEDDQKVVRFVVGYQFGPGENPEDEIAVFAFSSNTALFPESSLIMHYVGSSGNDHQYSLTLDPPQNAYSPSLTSPATITLRANVNGYIGTNSELKVLVFPVNDEPVLTLDFNAPIVTYANEPKTVNFTVSDVETEARDLVVTIPSISPSGVVTGYELECTDGDCALTLTPISVTTTVRTTFIDIRVEDEDGAYDQELDIEFKVNPNALPIVEIPGGLEVHGERDVPFVAVPFVVRDQDRSALTLRIISDSLNPATLINKIEVTDDRNGNTVVTAFSQDGTVVLPELPDPDSVNLTLNIYPNAGIIGKAEITIRARDAGGFQGSESFTLVISTPGDVNNDGQVTLADAIMALKILSGISVSGVNLMADLDPFAVNKRIGMEEVIYILQYVAMLR